MAIQYANHDAFHYFDLYAHDVFCGNMYYVRRCREVINKKETRAVAPWLPEAEKPLCIV